MEQQYLDLQRHILDTGVYKPNRTGVGATGNVGNMLKTDLRDGFLRIVFWRRGHSSSTPASSTDDQAHANRCHPG